MDKNNKHKNPSSLNRLFRKKWWVVIVVVVFVILLTGGGYLIYKKVIISSGTKDSSIKHEIDKSGSDDYSRATSVAAKDGPKAGQDVLDNELTKSNDVKVQAEIYINKSTLAGSYVGGSDKVKALDYAYKAEGLYPDFRTALSIASLEEKSNIQNSIKYYKLYLERAPKNSASSEPGDYEYYSSKLKQLQGLVK